MSKSETQDPLHLWLTDPTGANYADVNLWKHTPIETFIKAFEATGLNGVNYLHVRSGAFLKSGKTLGESGIREDDVIVYCPNILDLDQAVGFAVTGKIPFNKAPKRPIWKFIGDHTTEVIVGTLIVVIGAVVLSWLGLKSP